MAHSKLDHVESEDAGVREIASTLWKYKLLILLTGLVTTIVAAAYVLFSVPRYQASALTLPPEIGDVSAYNIASQVTAHANRGDIRGNEADRIKALSPDFAYEIFLKYLNASSTRLDFFEKEYWPALMAIAPDTTYQEAWKRFNDDVVVKRPASFKELPTEVIVEGEDPQLIAKLANAYVSYASTLAKQTLLDTLRGEIEVRLQGYNKQIAALMDIAERVRHDEIKRVEDALSIAEAIGLEVPASNSSIITIGHVFGEHRITSADSLYLKGAKALRSELEQLKARNNDEPYISELPSLLKKIALLENIHVDTIDFKVAILDKAASAPESPVHPEKLMTIVLGAILGVVLGTFIVLARLLIKRPEY